MLQHTPAKTRTQGLEVHVSLCADAAFMLSSGFRAAAANADLTVPPPADWRDPLVHVRYQTPIDDLSFAGRSVQLFLPTLPLASRQAVSKLFGKAMSAGVAEGTRVRRQSGMVSDELLNSITDTFLNDLPEGQKSADGVRLDFMAVRHRMSPEGDKGADRQRIFELVPDTEQAAELRYRCLLAIANVTGLRPVHPLQRARPNGQNLRLPGLAIGAIAHVAGGTEAIVHRRAWIGLEQKLKTDLLSNGPVRLTFGRLLFNPAHNPPGTAAL